MVVYLTRHEFFSGPVRTRDEHPRVGWRHGVDHVLDLLNAFGVADHLVGLRGVDLLGQHLGGLHQHLALQDVSEGHEDAVQVERLLDEVVRALLQGVHGRFDRAVSGNHDDGRSDLLFGQHVQHIEAVHLGHFDVAENRVKRRLGRGQNAVHARSGFGHLVTFVFQDFAEARADGRFVVNEEQVGHGLGFGT